MKARKMKDYECVHCEKPYSSNANRTKYCSVNCSEAAHYAKHMMSPKFRLSRLCGMAKNRAKNKGLPFNISAEYMLTLWTGKCSLTGVDFVLGKRHAGRVQPYTPSIDRIVPALGYVKGNVRLVTYQMNVALSEFGVGQFEKFINQYMKFNGGVQ